jgi:propanol-preferring alcohol dehydrogenase
VANYTRDDAREFLELAATIPVTTRVDTSPLADANAALRRMAADRGEGTAVLTT